jgi:hypothetical protein
VIVQIATVQRRGPTRCGEEVQLLERSLEFAGSGNGWLAATGRAVIASHRLLYFTVILAPHRKISLHLRAMASQGVLAAMQRCRDAGSL